MDGSQRESLVSLDYNPRQRFISPALTLSCRWHELASVPSRRVEHCFVILSYRTVEQDTPPDIAPIAANMIEARRFDLMVIKALLLE